MKYPAAYRRITAAVRQMVPDFADFVLEPSQLHEQQIFLNWTHKGRDYEFGPHQLSDGTLRFIALSTLLLQPEDRLPLLIALDEPELGLHPAALEVMAGMAGRLVALPGHPRDPVLGLPGSFRPRGRGRRQLPVGHLRVQAALVRRAGRMARGIYPRRDLGEERGRRGAVRMKRLYLTVEGQTEAAFAVSVLQAHLASFNVFLHPPRFTGLHGRRRGASPAADCCTRSAMPCPTCATG